MKFVEEIINKLLGEVMWGSTAKDSKVWNPSKDIRSFRTTFEEASKFPSRIMHHLQKSFNDTSKDLWRSLLSEHWGVYNCSRILCRNIGKNSTTRFKFFFWRALSMAQVLFEPINLHQNFNQLNLRRNSLWFFVQLI